MPQKTSIELLSNNIKNLRSIKVNKLFFPNKKISVFKKFSLVSNNLSPILQDKPTSQIIKPTKFYIEDANNIYTSINLQQPNIISTLEENAGILAQAKAACYSEDFNLLLKKLILNFRSKNNKSSFLVRSGVFAGVQFDLEQLGQTLDLNIKNSPQPVIDILNDNKNILCKRLAQHNIHLGHLHFVS